MPRWGEIRSDENYTAGGSAEVKQVEINFGAAGTRSKVFTITDAAVSPTTKVMAYQSGDAATGKSQDEMEMDALICRAVAGTGQFTLYVDSVTGSVAGAFKVNYILG